MNAPTKIILALALLFTGCDDAPKEEERQDDPEALMCPEVDDKCGNDVVDFCVELGKKILGEPCQVHEECDSAVCLQPWGKCSRDCWDPSEYCDGGSGLEFGMTYSCDEVMGMKLCIQHKGDPVSH